MKSSDVVTRVGGLAAMLAALATLFFVQPRMLSRFQALKVTSDVYTLPSPDHVIVASLGYRSAMADLIFAHTLVSSGLHLEQKRRFEYVADYLDTVIALDPKFYDTYHFADSLITVQTVAPTWQDYQRTAKILERGLVEYPYDPELWTNAGQWFAYVAWSWIPPEEQDAWRKRGAEIMARACEMGSTDSSITRRCVAAATVFNKLGEHEAMIEFLQRILILAEDEDTRQKAQNYLNVHLHGRAKELANQRVKRFQEAWANDFTFVSRDLLLVLGPRFSMAECVGEKHASRLDCATSWKSWHEAAAAHE